VSKWKDIQSWNFESWKLSRITLFDGIFSIISYEQNNIYCVIGLWRIYLKFRFLLLTM
jgi:hypothetical protein